MQVLYNFSFRKLKIIGTQFAGLISASIHIQDTHIQMYTREYITTNVYITHQREYTLTVCRPLEHHGCPTVCHR